MAVPGGGLDRVVGLVNRLQQICSSLGETALSENAVLWNKLTTIVVVGGQSSGKSSVLEAVVGRDFLPRGAGIVTKRPLVLQLVKVDGDPNAAEYGEFVHTAGKKWSDFLQIQQEIEDETERHLAKIGGTSTISPDPIYLTVYSPNVPNLTMVDMPGLTKVPIDGQPLSIVQELDDMVRQYIKGDNAIILAVTPANADLATSDALRMAREVDPTCERTIGVLTKVDIMDRGTDCRDVLLGKTLKLRNGWVAVVNRGQADINSKAAISKGPYEGCKGHRDIDSSTTTSNMPTHNHHGLYEWMPRVARRLGILQTQSRHTYPHTTCGHITYLSEKLSTHLINEIMKNLPSISSYIDQNIAKLERDLKALGGDVNFGRGSMLHLILKLCRKVEEAFMRIVDGGKDGGEHILDIFEL
eukprot:gene16681-22940_t